MNASRPRAAVSSARPECDNGMSRDNGVHHRMPGPSARRPSAARGLGALVAVIVLGTLIPTPSPVRAGDSEAVYSERVDLDAPPAEVAAATWCAEDGPGHAVRRRFSGYLVFTVQCPGNNANFIQALIVADNEAGLNARLLVFPTPFPPLPGYPNDALSNVGWLEGGVLSDLFIDPEEIDGPCRHEARWRLAGPVPTPELISWRETQDCEGNGGWTVLVGPGP